MNITEQFPLQRASHRWMSVFDAASRYLELQKAVTLFYSSWLTFDEKKKIPTTFDFSAKKCPERIQIENDWNTSETEVKNIKPL